MPTWQQPGLERLHTVYVQGLDMTRVISALHLGMPVWNHGPFVNIIKADVRFVLENEMPAIKVEIQAAKTEIFKNEVAVMGNGIEQMDKGLSGYTDDAVALQRTI